MAASEFRTAEHRLWDSLEAGPRIEHRLELPTVGATVRVQEVGHGPAAMLGQFGLSRAIEEGRFSDEMPDWLVTLFRHTDTLDHEVVQAPPVVGVRHGWDQRVVHDERILAAVTAPACMVWGEEDPFGDPDVARRLAAGLSDARLHLLPRTGHAPWLDDLDGCVTIARDFLLGRAASADP